MNDTTDEEMADMTENEVSPAEQLARAARSDADLDWGHQQSAYDDDVDLMLFRKRVDRMRNPRNRQVFDRIVLESVDWVNMVALDEQGLSVMIRQFRFGVGYSTLETPGGMVDPGEDALTAAKRELLEETGYGGGRWRYLGAVEPNPAFHDHLCHHFLAEGVTRQADQDLGAGESIRIELMTPEAVSEAVCSGELRHALALSALSRVFELWPRPFVPTLNQ